MNLLKKFDELMSHLNGEENDMAEKFRKALVAHIAEAREDGDWRLALEAAGVDNWSGYSDAFDSDEDDDWDDEDEEES